MSKLLTTIALVAFTSVALSGGALAGGGIDNNQPPGEPQYKPVGGAKKGANAGEIESPGDAFYPDRSFVGDPRQDCLDAGGKPARQHGAAIEWVCIL